MTNEEFIKAITEDECCAGCRFFKTDEPITFPDMKISGNELGKRYVTGYCKRFPPAVVKHRKRGREPVWEQPFLKVTATAYQGDKNVFIRISDSTFLGETPWCGEFQPSSKIEYVDAEEAFVDDPEEEWDDKNSDASP